MVELMAQDFPITWELVEQHVTEGATVGRPHIADALIALGIVTTRAEAFDRILTARSPYWVSHYAPHPATAVALIRDAGFSPVERDTLYNPIPVEDSGFRIQDSGDRTPAP